MRYYVDCEFNGSGGQLLSIALAREDGPELYCVLPAHEYLQPWIVQNVVPALGQGSVSWENCRWQLRNFLAKDGGPATFVTDWPEDVLHLMRLLVTAPLERMPPGAFRCLVLDLPGFVASEASAMPHNALEDAKALRAYVEQGIVDGSGGPLPTRDLLLLKGT